MFFFIEREIYNYIIDIIYILLLIIYYLLIIYLL